MRVLRLARVAVPVAVPVLEKVQELGSEKQGVLIRESVWGLAPMAVTYLVSATTREASSEQHRDLSVAITKPASFCLIVEASDTRLGCQAQLLPLYKKSVLRHTRASHLFVLGPETAIYEKQLSELSCTSWLLRSSPHHARRNNICRLFCRLHLEP